MFQNTRSRTRTNYCKWQQVDDIPTRCLMGWVSSAPTRCTSWYLSCLTFYILSKIWPRTVKKRSCRLDRFLQKHSLVLDLRKTVLTRSSSTSSKYFAQKRIVSHLIYNLIASYLFSILMMRNDGIIMRLLLNSWPPHIPTVQASWVRVTLADISPILYMFSLGAILALFFLMAEKVVHFVYWKKKPKEKKTTYKTGLVYEGMFVRF